MEKVLVKYDSGKVITYDIVTFRKYKGKEVLSENLNDLLSHPAVIDYEFTTPKNIKGSGNGKSKTYVSKNERENIPLPLNLNVAKEIVFHAKSNGKGFTKELVDSWNPHLSFDLHSKLQRYGFSGSSRLNTIFKI